MISLISTTPQFVFYITDSFTPSQYTKLISKNGKISVEYIDNELRIEEQISTENLMIQAFPLR